MKNYGDGLLDSHPDDLQTKSSEVHLRAGRKRTIWTCAEAIQNSHTQDLMILPCAPTFCFDESQRRKRTRKTMTKMKKMKMKKMMMMDTPCGLAYCMKVISTDIS